jgi:uncharacterized protein
MVAVGSCRTPISPRCTAVAEHTCSRLADVILRDPAQQLDPRVRRLWALEALLVAAGVAVAVAVATMVLARADETTAATVVGVVGGLTVVVGGAAGVLIAPGVAYNRFGYEVTDLGLYVASGVVWRRWQVVPHARVQTVDTRSGPLQRLFGIVSVAVTTASAQGGTEVPGLDPRVADALLTELARHAGIEEGT